MRGIRGGVSREQAQRETEEIFFDMDRYFMLPSPRDLAHVWEAPNTPEPIRRIWMTVRIMPYAGPGSYDGTGGVFNRSTEKVIAPGTIVPAIAFVPLPWIEIDGVGYSVLSDDSAIAATIGEDGAGSLTFSNVRSEEGSPGHGISGEIQWTCMNAAGG